MNIGIGISFGIGWIFLISVSLWIFLKYICIGIGINPRLGISMGMTVGFWYLVSVWI